MATKTWALKVGQFGTVQVKGLKKEVEHLFYNGFSPILKIQNYATEINGIIGGEERKHTYMSMFTPSGGHVDVETWQEDMTELFKGLPNPIVDLSGTMTRCQALFTKHCPVIDKRKTQGQVDAENIKSQEIDAAIKAKQLEVTRAWLTQYADSPDVEMIDVPAGHMAITCRATYDDSDIMTDYFNRHASVGPVFLLAIVPIQSQTERLMRDIMEKYPDLAALTWEWRTENYSMGHGNYLMSGVVGKTARHAQDGRQEVAYGFEVQAQKSISSKWGYYPFKGYTPDLIHQHTTGASGSGGTGDAHYNLNAERNGIEIKFSGKPHETVLSTLKMNGFRWSKFQKLWYARQSEKTLQIAHRLCEAAA